MNSALTPRPVHPVEDYEEDLRTFEDGMRDNPPVQSEPETEWERAMLIGSVSVAVVCLLGAIVWSLM